MIKEKAIPPKYEFIVYFLGGLQTSVYVPGAQGYKTLGECSHWELLNLNIDDVCSMTEDVKKQLNDPNLSTELDDELNVRIVF